MEFQFILTLQNFLKHVAPQCLALDHCSPDFIMLATRCSTTSIPQSLHLVESHSDLMLTHENDLFDDLSTRLSPIELDLAALLTIQLLLGQLLAKWCLRYYCFSYLFK